jgi:Bacterial Ig-like domain (group 3)
MVGKKLKSIRVGRFGRAALMLGVATATAGTMVLGAGAAHAQGVGLEPGDVSLSPATGSVDSSPTWATTVGCPTGFQGSAVFRIEEGGGNTFSLSGAVASVTSAFSGTLQDPLSTIQQVSGLADGGTDELVVYCFAGASLTGASSPEMSTYLTISADGTTYSTSATPPPPPSATATTTTLTAAPNPATVGATVTLTADTSAADSTNPAGSVQFESGGTAIGSPVAVSGTGVATTTTTFAAAGTESLSAVFTPTSTTYATSTGTYSETVNVATTSTTGSEPLAVTVPATGSFTLTVATGTVNLAVAGATATGALNPITVTDTRNTFPGWSVSGQTSDFTGSGSAAGGTIPGNQLGWVPTDTSIATGATLGGTVTPASPGLGTTAAVLASAAPGGGAGTSALGANLTLDIPASALAGPYGATLTVTAVTTGP